MLCEGRPWRGADLVYVTPKAREQLASSHIWYHLGGLPSFAQKNGEGGIRTRGKDKPYTAFPRPLDKPLRHLSGVCCKYSRKTEALQGRIRGGGTGWILFSQKNEPRGPESRL